MVLILPFVLKAALPMLSMGMVKHEKDDSSSEEGGSAGEHSNRGTRTAPGGNARTRTDLVALTVWG